MGNSGKCIHYGEKVANMTKHVQETHGYTTITAQKKKKKRKKSHIILPREMACKE